MSIKTPSFTGISVRIRVNSKKLQRLQDAGLLLDRSTAKREAERETARDDEHGAAHRQRGGGRTDATGLKRGDDGKPVFGFDARGAKHEAISLARIRADIEKAGYVLSNVQVKKKEGDRRGMGFLILWFNPAENTLAVELTPTQDALINGELARYFGFLHIWDNSATQRTATVNPSHAVPQDRESSLEDPRVLRFMVGDDGKPRWRNRKVTIPAANLEPSSEQPIAS